MIHCHNVAKIMPPHYANYDGRGIHHLQQYSGPHRGGFCQVAYESESDTESDSRGHHPLTAQQPHTETNTTQVLPTSGCFAQVAQATLKNQDPVDHQENPVVPAVAALQVHGGPEKQRRE